MKKMIISERLQSLIAGKKLVIKDTVYFVFIPIQANIDKIGNYFDIRSGLISYCPSNKEQQFADSGKWKREGRELIKAGKFAALLSYYDSENNAIKGINFSNIYEAVANIIKGDALNDGKFKISGKISKVYELETAEEAGEYLKNSCMRHESTYGCREYSNFYDNIPGLKILYKTNDNNKLLFRALFWNVSLNGKRKIFLDRIYGSDADNSYLIDLAKERDWLFRIFGDSGVYNKDYSSLNVFFPSGVDLLERYKQGTPYMDTLSYLTTDNELNNHDGDYRLQECDGNASGRETCCECGNSIDDDYSYTSPNGSFLCENCFYDSYNYCSHCGDPFETNQLHDCDGNYYCEDCAEGKGYRECNKCDEWHNEYYIVDDDCYCNDCYEKYCFHCEDCEEDHVGTSVSVCNETKYVCKDCAEDYIECEECGELFHKDDIVEVNGKQYCESCVPQEVIVN